ncbi:transient receptor potential cation channel subfamily M member 2-like [Mytilus trossulus]|uniref:transient receptor potential cation channel subfamily M member 2-like n=1 Tax=Mytilus trossulus TaxID=6551 RepID=UPI003006A4FD
MTKSILHFIENTCRIKQTDWDSKGFGHIFFALLKKHHFTGAMQLIETGNIRIHYIIIGCVILEDEANDWKTTPLVKEKLQCAKEALTATAVRITSCIYEADKEAKSKRSGDDGTCYKKTKTCVKGKNSEYRNHAGRLLLNHGYMRDAIDTGNMAYLENDKIKNILNKMWFGTKEVNWTWQTMICFTALVAVHIIVLPLLMFNMEKLPLLWFYRKYNLPFMKVYIHMLGFLVLFLAYAYMLLFDYQDDVITYTDGFIIAWMTSFFVDEAKQVTVAIIRGKFVIDWWDILDWTLIVVYATGMLLKFHEGSGFQTTSKVLLVAEFMALCTRILHLCCMTEFLGPKLVVIRKMVADTIAFMFIMTIIMVWYSVSINALLYPNSAFSWKEIEKILSNGYWTLFGELNLDSDTLTPPYCTFNRTIYPGGALQRCPTQLGLYISPYLKALYGLIAVVLLLNLLIAMYSHTFNEVQKKSDVYWRKKQNCFLEEYSIKTVFPVHLQLLALPGIILAVMWFGYSYFTDNIPKSSDVDELDKHPMFVRVFLYNTNYDLRLTETDEAEKNGAKQAKG